jgi:hypothetical protein
MTMITNTTPLQFFFNDLPQFEGKVAEDTLVPGGLYFVGNSVRLATTENAFDIIGGVQIGTPPDKADAEEGVFYYDPNTGVLQIIAKKGSEKDWIYLTQGFSAIRYGEEADGEEGQIFFVQQNGEEVELALPITKAIDEDDPSEVLLPTEKAIVAYIAEKLGTVASGLYYMGTIDASTPPLTVPIRKGEMWRVVADVTFMGVSLRAGDWFVAKANVATPTAPAGDTHFDIFPYVEVVPYAGLDSGDDHVPLAASQGTVIVKRIEDLDEAKIDKIEDAEGGRVALTTAEGGIIESELTVVTSNPGIDLTGGASDSKLPTEKAVATQVNRINTELEGKVDLLPLGTPNNIVTSTEDGKIQLSGYTIGTEPVMNVNPATASLTTLPNERAIATAIRNVSEGAVLYWNTD